MIEVNLPEYPAHDDVWQILKRESRPIVIYGMGNGADKLLSEFEYYGIPYADFFASDGFVRGHTFHGVRVKTLSEIRELYSDFVIVLSFASNREEVISLFVEIDNQYELYIPDMPVAGKDYFTKEFYNENYEKIVLAYNALADDFSKNLFASVLHFKLFSRLPHLLKYTSKKSEIYSLLQEKNIRRILDGGAYNGDTAKEFLAYFENVEEIIAVEPDPKTYKRLLRTIDALAPELAERGIRIVPKHTALSDSDGVCVLNAAGNRNTSLIGASYQHRTVEVPSSKIDTLLAGEGVNFIKFDVEGEEQNALIGADKTIRKYTPRMLISLYHRSEDIFSLIVYMKKTYPNYTLYLRRICCVPAWELDLIAIPKIETHMGT